jgi:hypothetical protein
MKVEVGQVYVANKSFKCRCGHSYLPKVTVLEEIGDSFKFLQEDKDTTPDGTGHGDASVERIVKKEEFEGSLEDFSLYEAKNEEG